jgi:peptidoglycan/xylan/chitin deacetylase (PgdA/CDA1 family)
VAPPPDAFSTLAVNCPPAPYGVQRSAPGAGKTVALTFDDGPGASTDQILRILTANGVPATFFDIGINEQARPATVRSIADHGFLLGNHTWSHPDMARLPAAQQAAEMDNASNQQAGIVGSRPCFFRPPYGSYNTTTLDLAQARNMAVFNWSVDTRDWEARGSADQAWVNQIISLAQAGASQTHPVILFHNAPAGNPATAAALPSIISFYRDRGYTFVDLAGRTRAQELNDISPVAVAAARTSAGTAVAFVRGTDGAVYTTTGSPAGFGAFQRIAGFARSGPAAVSWDGRRIDLFVSGSDRALWHTWTTADAQGRPTSWAAWESLGGVLTTAPAVAASTAGTLLVSGRGTDDAVWVRAWDGAAWRPWTSLGGTATSAPAVDVVDAATYRTMVVGTNGAVFLRAVSTVGAPLAAWSSTGVLSRFAPGLSATAGWARSVRALAVSNGAGVRQIWGNGGVVDIGGGVTSAVALQEVGTTQTWTFARGTDNALWFNVTTVGVSSSWLRIGGVVV